MRKAITAIGLASILTLGPAAVSYAQTDQAAAQEAEDDDSDKTGLWGLLGLLGLAGLAGLKRRNDPYDRTTTSGTGTTRP